MLTNIVSATVMEHLREEYTKYFRALCEEHNIDADLYRFDVMEYIGITDFDYFEDLEAPPTGSFSMQTGIVKIGALRPTEEVLETIRHEFWHIWQYENIGMAFMLEDMEANSYWNQEIEIDARKFATTYNGKVKYTYASYAVRENIHLRMYTVRK